VCVQQSLIIQVFWYKSYLLYLMLCYFEFGWYRYIVLSSPSFIFKEKFSWMKFLICEQFYFFLIVIHQWCERVFVYLHLSDILLVALVCQIWVINLRPSKKRPVNLKKYFLKNLYFLSFWHYVFFLVVYNHAPFFFLQ
jgi:hypothetical protein